MLTFGTFLSQDIVSNHDLPSKIQFLKRDDPQPFDFIQANDRISYVPYSGCVLEHILHNETLTDQQKLFYLLADSLSLISSKNNTLHRSVALSSTSWARTLNCSKSEIFSMQKNMEEKGYFIVLRDKNQLGKNKRNVICPTLPNEVFDQLVESPNRFKVSKDKLAGLALTNKRAYLDRTKLFVKINYQLINIIIADQQLALLAKILWLDLYLKYYKRQIKNNPLYKADDNFSFVVCYSELQKSLNCSKASLSKAMNQLSRLGFLTKQRFHVRNDNEDDNLHDKSLWTITLSLPEHYQQQMMEVKPRAVSSSLSEVSCGDPYISKITPLLNKDLISNNKDLDYLDSDSKISADFAESSSLSESFKNSLEELEIGNDNSLDLSQQEISTAPNFLEIASVKQEESKVLANPIAFDDQQAAEIIKPNKSLKSFYPLTKEQVDKLNQLSDREFSVNFANQLLMKLYCRDQNKQFLSKNHMISYMSKAFRYELHQSPLVNHQSFCFAVNQDQEDKDQKAREKYLAEVEYSVDTSYYSQLRRKIASIFEPDIAYQLLTEGKFDYQQADEQLLTDPTLRVELPDRLILTDKQQEILGKAIYTVYGFTSVIYEKISPDNFIKETYKKHIAKNIKDSNLAASKKSDQENSAVVEALKRDSVWYKIRQQLKADLGEFVDKTWLSKLTAEEDKESKTLNLYAPSNFIRDWITNNYRHRIRQICQDETDFVLDEIATIKISK